MCCFVVFEAGGRTVERQRKSRPERSIYIPGQSRLSGDKSTNTDLLGLSRCTKANSCTSACNDSIQAADKNLISSLSTDDKDSHLECTASSKPASSQSEADLVTCKTSGRNESADGIYEPTNDLKCSTVCSAEKQPRNDRHQRREKHPDIQRYVPKPKQPPQRDPMESLASSAVSVKSSNHGDVSELTPQSHRSESASAAEHCSSKSGKSTPASLPHSFHNLSSAVKTTEHEDTSRSVVKQKVSKPVKSESQSNRPKQEASECVASASDFTKADTDKRGKSVDSVRSEMLDWDFDGEFEFGHDGLSWGDLPPPSDHDSSDDKSYDDHGVRSASAANVQIQKPRKLRGNSRRGTKKKQTQNTETLVDDDYTVSEQKFTGGIGNPSTDAQTCGFDLTKIADTACKFVEDRESPIYGDEMSSKNHDIDDLCSRKVSTKSYSQSRWRKDVTGKPHLAVKTESGQRTGSKEQMQSHRNTLRSVDKQHSDTNSKEPKGRTEENTQRRRPDTGKIGGIIHLPVGTVTTVSHDAPHSAPLHVSTSTRGRSRRSAHGTSGIQGLWSPDKLQSLPAPPHQGLAAYENTQPHASYAADYPQYFQRQSVSPQMYYAEYPPVTGASRMPTVDGYVCGYPAVAYDGVGYVDDSYYH